MTAQAGVTVDAERERLAEARDGAAGWYRWGPYLSDRQWGTVREDYSAGGEAWDSFPHDHARSRAYRWGEDGLLGISDLQARLCFSIALWNGKDTILKERLFGLTGPQGNHGEDVKEASATACPTAALRPAPSAGRLLVHEATSFPSWENVPWPTRPHRPGVGRLATAERRAFRLGEESWVARGPVGSISWASRSLEEETCLHRAWGAGRGGRPGDRPAGP